LTAYETHARDLAALAARVGARGFAPAQQRRGAAPSLRHNGRLPGHARADSSAPRLHIAEIPRMSMSDISTDGALHAAFANAAPSGLDLGGNAVTSPQAMAEMKADLALALRAAAHHGLAEGVCNHFSVAVSDKTFLINPRGLHWSEVDREDIVLVDELGNVLEGKHRVEPTALFIHAAVHRICGHKVVLHTHMPYATALTLTEAGAIDPYLSQNAMRFVDRIAIDPDYNGLALDQAEGERIARSMQGKDVGFLANHGVIVAGDSMAHAYDDLYFLERAAQHQVLAAASGSRLKTVNRDLAQRVAAQVQSEREQSDLFFEALRRLLPSPARAQG
jgi:ribulose-5-phosphate 4-epimerase/fuculose-1-phosphate aldolase